jgi:serine/threonine-protein kinase
MAEVAPRSSRLPQLAKYEVLEEIGHGGMATVYRARDKRLGREVAVKLIHPHLRDSREVVARFNTEAKAVAKLHHANIVEVFDVSEADEIDQYLVVELIRGTTLRKLLQSRGSMPPEIAAAIGIDLLGAISHAHASGVIHRDIKPENVLIEHRPADAASETPSSRDGTSAASPRRGQHQDARVIVKLTDFGIAKLLDAQGVTSTGQVLGSPAHMAPEQIEGGEVDSRADTFGMGVLLYECMVGHLPFEGNNPAQVLRRVLDGQYPEAQREKPSVGSRWSALLDRALAHAPKDRFADAAAMRTALVDELARVGISAPRQELESWLDDGAAYEKAFNTRMVDTLCALGDQARKRGESLQAASDWNRALAHAPANPKLLRLVAGMHRAEARARMVRRASQALGLSLVLGVAAFAVGRLVQSHPHPVPVPTATAATVSATPPPPPPSASASGPQPSAVASHTAPAVTHAASAASAAPPKATERTITLHLSPPMGVTLSVDGVADPKPKQTGDTLTLSTKAHFLEFSCPVCTPVERQLAAADDDQDLSVVVPVHPATLIIDGPADGHYQVTEYPRLSVHAGSNTIPMDFTLQRIRVRELTSGQEVKVNLEAEKATHAPF